MIAAASDAKFHYVNRLLSAANGHISKQHTPDKYSTKQLQRTLIESDLFQRQLHWNGNVFILMKFSSLAALEVVKMTTSSAASD